MHADQASAGSTASSQGGGSPSLPQPAHDAARGALQDPPSAAMNGSSSRPQAGHPLPQRPPQLDPSILARMVTAQGAQGPGAAGLAPFRVASMQEFRRSRNSLNTVHEASQQPRPMAAPNQAFALNMNRPSVPSGAGPRASENPLLKMMEARMAAKAAGASTSSAAAASQPALPTIAQSPSPPPVVGAENNAALQASISKWAGMGGAASSAAAGAEKKPMDKPTVQSPQVVAATGSPSGRAPLSAKQIDLLKELTASQDGNAGAPAVQQPAQPTEKELLFQMLVSQASGTGLSPTAGAQAPVMGRLPPSLLPVRNNAQPGLARCAVSLAEVDRLRRANQAIQFQQQVAMQQRALQKQRTEQAQLNERNIAANALLSMQNNGAQTQVAANIGGQLVTQDMLNQIQANALNRIKTSSGELPQTFRKRRSVREPFDDEDDTSCSASSHTHSITSSASSHKIHRSLSHSSARAALSGSMENLCIRSHAHLLSSSSRNQSFSSGSFAGGMNMQNQSFGSSSTSSQAALQQSSSHAALRRSSSSQGWIQSMLAEQRSAGKAAEIFEQVLTQASPNLASTSPGKSVSPVHEEAKAVSPKAIQVQAEEYSAPPIERPASTSGETVIVSAIPDRIKYQNAEPDTKPIEVVKQALQDRGEKCDIKPTVDVADDFFTKVTEMYDQEVVSAIRASDVDALRKLHKAGTTLQCGNRFGETLIHLACRRSHRDVVSFLVNEVGVSLRVRDDYGRTPMHDACWRAEPDLELLDLLLDRAPELLMLSDKRGHSPLDYGRREHWAVLIPFLQERKAKFRPVP